MTPSRREAITGAAALGLVAATRGPARRVVSLNPCLDALLLAVADPSQVAALSHYSHDPDATTPPQRRRA